MDYEKKYNEALERARKAYNAIPQESRGARKIIEDAFPELRESEDERMCNKIIDYLLGRIDVMPSNINERKILVAWLEKQKEPENTSASTMIPSCWEVEQKEQKPELVQHPPITYMYPSDASRDEQLKRAIIALLNSDLIKVAGNKFTKQDLIDWVEKQKEQEEELVYRLNGLMQDYIKEGKDDEEKEHRLKCYQLFWDALEDTNFFEQKEQKPNIEICPHSIKSKSYLETGYPIEQKPSEWSEEDTLMLTAIIQTLERFGGRGTTGMQIDWLKSLRPQPKQEWSEEDEFHRQVAIRMVHDKEGNGKYSQYILDETEDWLKSLSPSWKPSEEHLSALLAVFNDPDNIGSQTCQLALTDLYEQLKKL